MKYKLLRFSLMCILAMLFGTVYAAEVTMKYSGTTTANMTGGNDAALLGLDATEWSVVGHKADASTALYPGLNKDGDFRLYFDTRGDCTITVTSLRGATINSISMTFMSGFDNVTVTVDGSAVKAVNGVWPINSTSFVLGNGNTISKQVQIKELTIKYEAIDPSEIANEATLTFATTGVDCQGVAPAEQTVNVGTKITIPANTTLYAEGKTLTGWTDGTNQYTAGQEVTVNGNMTLKPVFTQNTVSLSDRTSDVVLKWDLEPGKMWAFNGVQNKTGLLVIPATVNGETIDVKLDYETFNGGKLHNAGRSSWCQANKGTKFVVPSCKGATVQMLAYSAFGAEGKTATTVEGQSSYDSSTTLVYTTANKAETMDIVLGDDAGYLSYLQVTLPVVIEGGTLKEKAIIDTDFQDWTNSNTTSTVTTNFSNETITFTYSNTSVDPAATNDNKFNSTVDPAFKGYIMSDKEEATVTTSSFKNITKIRYRHGATGSNRGWGLKMKAAGDADWTLVSDATTNSTAWIEKVINKENVQLQWYNLNTSQNAYMFELEVYANVLVTAEQVTLATAVSPEGAGTVTVKPYAAEYDENTEVTLTAEKNFGYKFKQWTKDGEVIGTDATLAYTIAENSTVTAEFEAVDTYELKVNVDGSNDYMVTMNPMPNVVDGKMMYEAGTAVQLTANSYEGLVTFNNWSDGETSSSKFISMKANTELTAVYSQADIIAGWDFYLKGGEGRPADFASDGNETAALSLVYPDGKTSGWLDKSAEAAGGYESFKGAAVNWRNDVEIGSTWWQTKVNAENFTNIKVQFQMLYNYNAYQTYNAEYSLDGETWTKFGSIAMTGAKVVATFNGALPEACNNQKNVFIRMIADKTSKVDGSASANDGNALAMFFITGTEKLVDDGNAPELVSTVPVGNATGVSASGKVVLTFDEKVKLAEGATAYINDTKINSETQIAVSGAVSGKSISFEYKGLEYTTEYSFVLPANSVSDLTDNTLESPVRLTFTTMTRPTVTKGLYDEVVEDADGLLAAIAAADSRSDKNVRYRIFLKNGTYKLPQSTTETIHCSNGNDYPSPITKISSSNISFIGESRDGVIVTNTITDETYTADDGGGSVYEKIGNSDVLQLQSSVRGTYFQDLTVKSGIGDALGRNLAIQDKGSLTIYKNTVLWGYQDTWTSNNDNGLYYFEGGKVRGRTDFLCGKGDAFFNAVDIQVCMNTGGYIAVPSKSIKYGYVFKGCNILCENSALNGKYTLGRPWGQGTPVALWIDTKMQYAPSAIGWSEMSNGWPKQFAEWNSTLTTGTPVDLSGRKTSFGDGHPNVPVLTAEEALEAGDPHNMFGDWDPTLATEQAPVPQNVKQEGNNLVWDNSNYALLWAIVKDGSVVGFTTEPTYELTESGTYAVRAANEMGGLSQASESVVATVAVVVTVTLNGSGYATLASDKALDFSSVEGLKAYIVTSAKDSKATLTSVNVVPVGTGLVLKGTANEKYSIPVATTNTEDVSANMLEAAVEATPVETNAVYVLNGNVFKEFIGTEDIPAGKAFLPKRKVGAARLLEFVFGDATAIGSVNVDVNANQIYDLQGRRVKTPSKGVYVVDGKKVIIK